MLLTRDNCRFYTVSYQLNALRGDAYNGIEVSIHSHQNLEFKYSLNFFHFDHLIVCLTLNLKSCFMQWYQKIIEIIEWEDDIKDKLKCICCCYKANSFTSKLLHHLTLLKWNEFVYNCCIYIVFPLILLSEMSLFTITVYI